LLIFNSKKVHSYTNGVVHQNRSTRAMDAGAEEKKKHLRVVEAPQSSSTRRLFENGEDSVTKLFLSNDLRLAGFCGSHVYSKTVCEKLCLLACIRYTAEVTFGSDDPHVPHPDISSHKFSQAT
jgi:hypothetical protein